MTPKLKKLLKAYVDASIAWSWRGGTCPTSWPEMEAELERTRQELFAYLEELCATVGTPRE